MTDGVLDSAPGTPGPAERRRSRWMLALVTFGIATVLGLALASQWVLASANWGRMIPWPVALVTQLREAWLWVLFVPVVFLLARQFPLQREAWWRSVCAHILGGMLVAAVYSAMNTAILEWFTADQFRPAYLYGGRRPAPPPSTGTTSASSPAPAPAPGAGPAQAVKYEVPPLGQRFWFGFASRLHLNTFTYALIVAIWHWRDHQRRLRDRERQSQELSRQLAEARLQALQMQLNPHFLFNTLNAIATLVHRDPAAADEMIACLSDFLRLTLNAQRAPQTPLRTELEFARRYLDIEKVRFGSRLTVDEDIPAECLGVAVPTLVLQPLLENAIRHGIERSEENGRIELKASRDADRLVLRVGNSGPAIRDDRSRGGGVGLANTRARLHELHGDDAVLRLEHRAQGGLDVEIRLPWQGSALSLPN